MQVHLVNPSDKSFGIGVITPRWLYVLAAATPAQYGDPVITDETLERFDLERVHSGDVVGIGIHTSNAVRGMELGRLARERGAYVVYGGVHATLYPDEALEMGSAHAVVKGDGDAIWAKVIADLIAGEAPDIYDGGRVADDRFVAARWDLAPCDKYLWASIQTVRGCPHDSPLFLDWRSDGQSPRLRTSDMIVGEIMDLYRRGFRFIALADDNFYPACNEDLRLAEKQGNTALLKELREIRAERFELMIKLCSLPGDMVFFTQVGLDAAEDIEYLDAMRKAHIQGVVLEVDSDTAEDLKAVSRNLDLSGDPLARKLQTFKDHGIHILGSFTGRPAVDQQETFADTAELAKRAGMSFAQFVLRTPLPAKIDSHRWGKGMSEMSPAWTESRFLAVG